MSLRFVITTRPGNNMRNGRMARHLQVDFPKEEASLKVPCKE
jgi:hypothetical protein